MERPQTVLQRAEDDVIPVEMLPWGLDGASLTVQERIERDRLLDEWLSHHDHRDAVGTDRASRKRRSELLNQARAAHQLPEQPDPRLHLLDDWPEVGR